VQYIESLTSTIPIGKSKGISLYPNPTSGLLKLSIAETLYKDAQVSIYALDGDEVYRDQYQSGLQVKTLQLQHLAKGLYFIRVDMGADIYWGKIVVQ
jgi:hypothetical protein